MNFKNYRNSKFGKLTPIKLAYRKAHTTYWWCVCICGSKKVYRIGNVVSGSSWHCGCLTKQHGMHKSKEYKAWESMKARCNNPNSCNYKHYGAKGVKHCTRWNKFTNFFEDMGTAPSDGILDRINNYKGYFPKNCRWTDLKTSLLNRRHTLWLEYKGVRRTVKEWSELKKINYNCLRDRIRRKCPLTIIFNKKSIRWLPK